MADPPINPHNGGETAPQRQSESTRTGGTGLNEQLNPQQQPAQSSSTRTTASQPDQAHGQPGGNFAAGSSTGSGPQPPAAPSATDPPPSLPENDATQPAAQPAQPAQPSRRIAFFNVSQPLAQDGQPGTQAGFPRAAVTAVLQNLLRAQAGRGGPVQVLTGQAAAEATAEANAAATGPETQPAAQPAADSANSANPTNEPFAAQSAASGASDENPGAASAGADAAAGSDAAAGGNDAQNGPTHRFILHFEDSSPAEMIALLRLFFGTPNDTNTYKASETAIRDLKAVDPAELAQDDLACTICYEPMTAWPPNLDPEHGGCMGEKAGTQRGERRSRRSRRAGAAFEGRLEGRADGQAEEGAPQGTTNPDGSTTFYYPPERADALFGPQGIFAPGGPFHRVARASNSYTESNVARTDAAGPGAAADDAREHTVRPPEPLSDFQSEFPDRPAFHARTAAEPDASEFTLPRDNNPPGIEVVLEGEGDVSSGSGAVSSGSGGGSGGGFGGSGDSSTGSSSGSGGSGPNHEHMEDQEPVEEEPDYSESHHPLRMPCGHVFGNVCLVKWLCTATTCPICRKSLDPEPTAGPMAALGPLPPDLAPEEAEAERRYIVEMYHIPDPTNLRDMQRREMRDALMRAHLPLHQTVADGTDLRTMTPEAQEEHARMIGRMRRMHRRRFLSYQAADAPWQRELAAAAAAAVRAHMGPQNGPERPIINGNNTNDVDAMDEETNDAPELQQTGEPVIPEPIIPEPPATRPPPTLAWAPPPPQNYETWERMRAHTDAARRAAAVLAHRMARNERLAETLAPFRAPEPQQPDQPAPAPQETPAVVSPPIGATVPPSSDTETDSTAPTPLDSVSSSPAGSRSETPESRRRGPTRHTLPRNHPYGR